MVIVLPANKKYENKNYLYHLKGGRFIGNDINIFSPLNLIFNLIDVKIRLKKINFMSTPKIETFFTKLFASKILENEIVATVIYIISKKLTEFKIKMDNILNTDI